MGAVLAGEAALEIFLIVFGVVAVGGVTVAAMATINHAMNNCAMCQQPPPFQGAAGEEVEFRVDQQSDIAIDSTVSGQVKGKIITNSKAPFTFRFVVGKNTNGPRPPYHAGLLLRGSFTISGTSGNFDYLFAERWGSCVTIRLCKCRQQVLQRLRRIDYDGVMLDDCNETPEFESCQTAQSMVRFMHEELTRECRISGFSNPEDLYQPGITNCISFAVRAGVSLTPESRNGFVTACQKVLEN